MTQFFTRAVGRHGWHVYLAFDDDRPIAMGMLLVKEGLGWLGGGATLPSYRRRGAQNALLARRIQEAAALGAQWVVVETGEDRPERPNASFRSVQRAGFQLAYLRPNYTSP